MNKYFVSVALFLLLSTASQAADLQREARIAEQIEDAILDGETLRLQAGGVAFLAIETPSDARQARGTVILLHGRGAHPDWSDVIHPLRVGLPEAGWNTLSIQLPVASADAPERDWQALISEARPRITAAVAHSKAGKPPAIVLIAHSMGTHMALDYLASADADPAISALVAIGMSADPSQPDSGVLGALRKLRLPILDLYGERDLPSVRHSAKARRQAARAAGNTAYQQLEVPGADHFFSGLDDLLLSRIRAWLSRTLAPDTQ